jgi:hypothetical protein
MVAAATISKARDEGRELIVIDKRSEEVPAGVFRGEYPVDLRAAGQRLQG